MDAQTVYSQVQSHYGSLARASNSTRSTAIAQAFGYSEQELSSVARDANLGVSCGNPLAIASLREVRSLTNVLFMSRDS
jgi:arsenite methyltransferase